LSRAISPDPFVNAWNSGYLYDPESGKTYHYHAGVTLMNRHLWLRGSLERRGLAGRPFLWSRPPEKQDP